MITGTHVDRTSSSATALRTTSGPMPAGSPMVIPMRGLDLPDVTANESRGSVLRLDDCEANNRSKWQAHGCTGRRPSHVSLILERLHRRLFGRVLVFVDFGIPFLRLEHVFD